jgi:hypothetical protein
MPFRMSAHLDDTHQDVKVVFLARNSTSFVQRSRVIANVKAG